MAKLNALEHHVEDFDKEVNFFKNVLGLQPTREMPARMAAFAIADTLSLVVVARDPSHRAYSNFRGDTVCLQVPEVDSLYASIKAKGVTPRSAPTDQRMGVRNFFLETPGGLTLCYQTPFPARG